MDTDKFTRSSEQQQRNDLTLNRRMNGLTMEVVDLIEFAAFWHTSRDWPTPGITGARSQYANEADYFFVFDDRWPMDEQEH